VSPPPTRFSESNALLAMQQGDRIEARRILAGMLPHELRQLAAAARDLAWEADTEADSRTR
jgi:hypothetical protein